MTISNIISEYMAGKIDKDEAENAIVLVTTLDSIGE